MRIKLLVVVVVVGTESEQGLSQSDTESVNQSNFIYRGTPKILHSVHFIVQCNSFPVIQEL